MFFHVGARAEQSFFLAAPQGDANSAARLHADGLQNANGFHGDGAAGGVVGGSGAAVPGVEMRAEHDDLAALVGTRNLGDGVVGVGIGIVELVADVHLELDGNVAVEQA